MGDLMKFCTYEQVKQHIKEKNKLFSYIDNPKTFIVELFPYYVGNDDGNISKYARGKDYHIVVPKMLDEIIEKYKKQYPQNKFVSFCDNSPLPEVKIAYESGIGILGKNGLIFDEKYGGYVFIGIIATDLEIEFEKPVTKKCSGCNICVGKCPLRAISNEGIDKNKCLSNLTQINYDTKYIDEVAKSKYIWGCDICLDVCPMNQKVEVTPIIDFKIDLIFEISMEQVENLTRKQFKTKFFERAFTFRGPKPIIRNLSIKR